MGRHTEQRLDRNAGRLKEHYSDPYRVSAFVLPDSSKRSTLKWFCLHKQFQGPSSTKSMTLEVFKSAFFYSMAACLTSQLSHKVRKEKQRVHTQTTFPLTLFVKVAIFLLSAVHSCQIVDMGSKECTSQHIVPITWISRYPVQERKKIAGQIQKSVFKPLEKSIRQKFLYINEYKSQWKARTDFF